MRRFLAGTLWGLVAYTWGYRDGHTDGYRIGRIHGHARGIAQTIQAFRSAAAKAPPPRESIK